MASTYENDLRLEEMATGENSGSWGTKTNTNLELIADAFSYGTETIANADTTITIADGAADAARSLALKINSSADLTTTRTITLAPNTTSKVWIIENNTSGGQTLTISAGSGSNITLANGTTKIIATDGIGAGSNVVELTQDLAIADMSVDGILSLADGSNSAPSLTNTGDTNTGLYFPAADEVGITTGGTQRVKVDSTGIDVTGTVTMDGGSTSADFTFGDNDKAIFGAGSDLQIYAASGVSFIKESGAGNLNVNAANFILNNADDSQNMFKAKAGAEVELYYNNAQKLETTATGVDITGTLDVNNGANSTQAIFSGTAGRGLVISTESVGAADEGVILNATASGTTGKITFQTNDATSLELAGNGGTGTFHQGLIVNEDSAASGDFRVESDNNTHALFVDASADGVGIFTGTGDTVKANFSVGLTGAIVAGDTDGATIGKGGIVNLINGNNYNSTDAGVFLLGGGTGGAVGNISSGIGFFRENLNTWGTQLRFYVHESNTVDIDMLQETARFASSEFVINDTSNNYDFRVESDSNTHALFVDAGSNHVNIGTSSDLGQVLNVEGGLALGTDPTVTWTSNYIKFQTRSASVPVIEFLASTSGSYAPRIDMYNGAGAMQHRIDAGGEVIFNQTGANQDFRVESDTNTHMLFVDASANRIGIGTSQPGSEFTVSGTSRFEKGGTGTSLVATGNGSNMHLNTDGSAYFIFSNTAAADLYTVFKGSTYEALRFGGGNATFNEESRDYDFRVESDGASHMLYVDAGNDCTNIASTQTEAMFGGGFPSSGFVKNFFKSEAIKTLESGASSSTPARTITIVVNLNAYRGACVKINTSGHLYNNGGAYYNRVNEIYLASEGTNSRINSRVDILAAGTQIGQCGVPSASISGTNQFSITQTIGAGYTANVFVEVTGLGYSSMGSISIA